MGYKAFQDTITARLKERLGAGCRLAIRRIPKNNGIFLDGLTILPAGRTSAPVIYLNHYYAHYLEGSPMDELIDEIMAIYEETVNTLPIDFDFFNDFGRLREKVAYRLINTKANETMLNELVSFPFADLSVVFYLIWEESVYGQMTAMILKRHLRSWDVTAAELLELARKNTPRLLPPKLQNMTDVLEEIAKENMGDDYSPGVIDRIIPGHQESPLFVLTNTTGLNGACTMLYPNILKDFSDLLGRDLIILPSSIHEVLLVPYEECTGIRELEDMVATINREEVAVEDRLSDHVYFYSRDADEIVLMHDSDSAYTS